MNQKKIIKQYVHENINKGFSAEKIYEALEKQGYDKRIIGKAISDKKNGKNAYIIFIFAFIVLAIAVTIAYRLSAKPDLKMEKDCIETLRQVLIKEGFDAPLYNDFISKAIDNTNTSQLGTEFRTRELSTMNNGIIRVVYHNDINTFQFCYIQMDSNVSSVNLEKYNKKCTRSSKGNEYYFIGGDDSDGQISIKYLTLLYTGGKGLISPKVDMTCHDFI